ncbi:MAG: coproporphyrinogen III oxidase family protein [Planctomycetes bacterium]|nr:coproporphyrinogen III oxidase family protein [Planctomycetota bacterium]
MENLLLNLDVIDDKTDVGSYFIATYPPFSVWSAAHVPAALRTIGTAPTDPNAPLGLYLHIPFCRKRCKFCYFRIFTGKNSDEVETYLTALSQEVELYADSAMAAGRPLNFVYFGGGTPSFLSSDQLQRLMDRVGDKWRRTDDCEGSFECEPGTLRKGKLETIKAIGTTRLSLGIEHFDDDVLVENGRAHKSNDIIKSFEWAREVGFDQINVDLIAGMVGDTEPKWKRTIDETLTLDPDSVTIYQMELPPNSTYAREARESGEAPAVADWPTKRAWVDYAFRQFESAGYVMTSAYTVVKPEGDGRFVYRDAVWGGLDMIGTGVASFSHFDGLHVQNFDKWDGYIDPLSRGEWPIARAYPTSKDERLIREFVLQLKFGRLQAAPFREQYGVDVTERFADELEMLTDRQMLIVENDGITLTREGLLRVDSLLPNFFEPKFRNIPYS